MYIVPAVICIYLCKQCMYIKQLLYQHHSSHLSAKGLLCYVCESMIKSTHKKT